MIGRLGRPKGIPVKEETRRKLSLAMKEAWVRQKQQEQKEAVENE